MMDSRMLRNDRKPFPTLRVWRGCIFPPVMFSPQQGVEGVLRMEGILLHPGPAPQRGAGAGEGREGESIKVGGVAVEGGVEEWIRKVRRRAEGRR